MSSPTLRFVTLNVWALPLGIARHTEERMAAIGGRLGELDVDLAAFQEVWTDAARATLVAAGRRAGLVHAWHNPGAARGGSGLLLLSRHPLRDPVFERYRLAGLPQRIHHGDYWGGKGFVMARVETAAGFVTVLDTHLHAQYADDPVDEYRAMRAAQVIQLAAAVAARREPVVALGDFNLRSGNPDHAVLMGLTGFRDAALVLEHPQDTVLAPSPYRGGGHEGGERIDYAFTRTGERTDAEPRELERVFDETFAIAGETGTYSDHAGLRLVAEVVPQAPRTLPTVAPETLARARGLLRQGHIEARRRRGVERSLALGSAALAVAALPGAVQLRASRRQFLAALSAGVGVAAVPGAALAAWLSEVAVPREIAGYEEVGALLDGFVAG